MKTRNGKKRKQMVTLYKNGFSVTVAKLFIKLQIDCDFLYKETFRFLLKKIGFSFCILNKSFVIMESCKVVAWGYWYLVGYTTSCTMLRRNGMMKAVLVLWKHPWSAVNKPCCCNQEVVRVGFITVFTSHAKQIFMMKLICVF